MLLLEFMFLAFTGLLVGLLAPMVGVGGGLFIVPILTVIFEFTSQQAVGTSLAVIIFTSLASTYAYSRQKRIDYKIGLASAVTTVPGAMLGAYLTTLISSRMLGILFALFLIFVAAIDRFGLSFLADVLQPIARVYGRKKYLIDGTTVFPIRLIIDRSCRKALLKSCVMTIGRGDAYG